MAYPPYYHTRLRAEAYGQFATYATWAANSAEWSRRYRDEGDLDAANAFQHMSATEYDRARYYRAVYNAQGPQAEREKESRDGIA